MGQQRWLAALTATTYIVFCILIRYTAAQFTEPSWAPTGKLNQFRGFVTPRPLPENAEYGEVEPLRFPELSRNGFFTQGRRRGPNGPLHPLKSVELKSLNSSEKMLLPTFGPKSTEKESTMAHPALDAKSMEQLHLSAEDVKLHQEELDNALHSLQIRDEGRTGGQEARRQSHEDWPVDKHQTQPNKKGKVDKDSMASRDGEVPPPDVQKRKDDNFDGAEDITADDSAETKMDDEDDHHAALTTKEPVITTTQGMGPQPKTPGQVLEDADHFKQFGTRPEIVQPEDDLEDQHLTGESAELRKSISEAVVEAPIKVQGSVEDNVEELDMQPEIVLPKLSNTIDDEGDVEIVTPSMGHNTHDDSEMVMPSKDHLTTEGGFEEVTPSTDLSSQEDHLEVKPSTKFVPETSTIPEEPTSTVITSTTTSTTTTTQRPTTTSISAITGSESVAKPTKSSYHPTSTLIEGSVGHARKIVKSAEYSSYGISKTRDQVRKRKMKRYGSTGYKLRKNFGAKRYIHDGEVPRKSINVLKNTSAGLNSPIYHRNGVQEFSADTLKALDWMLLNITKIAEEGDEAFMKALAFKSDETEKAVHPNNDKVLSSTSLKPTTTKRPKSRRKGLKRRTSQGKSKPRKGNRNVINAKIHSGEFKSAIPIGKSPFPRYRQKLTNAVRARSFGIRTMNTNSTTAKKVDSTSGDDETAADPAKLLEEIARLEAMMNSVERKVKLAKGDRSSTGEIHAGMNQPFEHSAELPDKTLEHQEHRSNGDGIPMNYKQNVMEFLDKTLEQRQDHDDRTPLTNTLPTQREREPPAMDLSLVPLEKGFVPGASQTKEKFFQQPMHLITPNEATFGDSRWSDWSEWAECFCERQVRTRRCNYSGPMSQGCEGASYESRSCKGGFCPVSHAPTRPPSVAATASTLNRHEVSDLHRQLRPLRLNTATSLS